MDPRRRSRSRKGELMNWLMLRGDSRVSAGLRFGRPGPDDKQQFRRATVGATTLPTSIDHASSRP